MESVTQKLKRNLKEGTFFKNVPIALKNRLIRGLKTSNLLHRFDKGRLMTKKYQSSIPMLGSNGVQIGNYYLDARVPITEKSVIYSLGILTEISFDLGMQQKYGCEVFMYDPTPVSIEFMKGYASNPALRFYPVGVWIENKTLKFYEPKLGGSASLMDNGNTDQYFEAECLTMETLMQQNQHNEIAVFKADIEGAALPILSKMVKDHIFPDQIVVEFERPGADMTKIQAFFDDLSNLRTQLSEAGYEEYLLPRDKAKYFSLEMLFVRKDKIQ